MDHTLEVRWFYPGRPPASLLDWISDLGAEKESTRTDLYLVSDDPAMNVKLREGKVQTKHRLDAPSTIQFGSDVRGSRERWVKWSFALNGSHDLLDEDPTGLWVPVHKERLQLSLDADDQRDRIDDWNGFEPEEAALELTTVSARGETAWTICVESEGNPDGLVDTLRQAGDHLMQEIPRSMDADRSFGYAQWIRAHVS